MTIDIRASLCKQSLRSLRTRWWAAVGLFSLILLSELWLFRRGGPGPNVAQGILQTTVIMIYVLGLLRYGLGWNYHPDQKDLRLTLGYGTWLTITRGALIAVLAGYLFQPWPKSQLFPGGHSWTPGFLYIMVSILDAADGRIARAYQQETRLGAFLDINLDALGLLIASLVAVWYGQLPAVYLSVGCAYYVYRAGIRLRKKFAKPVFDPGPWRGARVIAGIQMGFVGIALLPVVTPGLTTPAAYVMMIPLLAGFLRDWMMVCGYRQAESFLKLFRLPFSTPNRSEARDIKTNKKESGPSGVSNAAISTFATRSTGRIDSIESLESCLAAAKTFRVRHNRPFITVSYAQSVDGSIATKSRQPIGLSGPESAVLTHQIRACSDAILIGIGTLLADDPRLNVRLVEGSSPQPIILDTHLRTPLTARIVNRSDTSPWIINAKKNCDEQAMALQNTGSTLIGCATSHDGKIDLDALMEILVEKRINSVMVEGGARVITSFVKSGLVDQFIVTVSPKFVGGLQVIESDGWQTKTHLALAEVSYRNMGDDLIIWARPSRPG